MLQPTVQPPSAPARMRIEMRHVADAAYWCRVFDVSPAQLRRAVQQVGPQVDEVRRYFARQTAQPRVEDSGF